MAEQAASPTASPAPAAAAPQSISMGEGLDRLMSGLMGAEDDPKEPAKEPAGDEKKIPEEGEDVKTDPAAEPAADLIEFEGPDGKPIQLSLADAISAYTERNDLTQKIAKLSQSQALMPQEVEAALLQTAQTRHQLLAEVDQLQATYKPQPPSRELLDKTSQNYDPDLFAAQLQDYERGMQWLQQIDQTKQQQKQILEREQSALHQATIARGRQQLQQVWPEVLTDQETQKGLAELLQHVGLDPATALSTVTDPRAYLVMKYAMQGLKAEAQAKGQLKAVKSTPRLVKGAGRAQSTAQTNGVALNRLQKTGRLDDALEYLMGSSTR